MHLRKILTKPQAVGIKENFETKITWCLNGLNVQDEKNSYFLMLEEKH